MVFRCLVHGPCLGKEFQKQKYLDVHTRKQHGVPVLAQKQTDHHNDLQRRRNLIKMKQDSDMTFKCTVEGPCFGQEFKWKQSLQKHMDKNHGDPVLAAEKSKHNNEMQCKRRRLTTDNANGVA